jgi:hypothetical protein
MSAEAQLASAALETLHGARELPSDEAAAVLRQYLESIRLPSSDSSPRLVEASGALENLIQKLKAEGTPSDDDWQSAIETMLSLANDAS